ncbi:MAG: hypothetical protein NTV07_06545 [Candidatus Omnitrophica bacterium]|nr:hypothetical protein [Candidatus Omnitrophota bacterium]
MRINAHHFNLSSSLECGQVFRWDKIGLNEYSAVLGRSIVKLKQVRNSLLIKASSPSITPSVIKAYFDLNLDLPYIYTKIGRDNNIKAAIRQYSGLRIIRQPLWECLASFIISTQNNIPRIRKIIEKLCQCFGEPVSDGGTVKYSFPEPGVLADLTARQLESCGTGYRAPYLIKTARDFVDKKISLGSLKKKPYIPAKEYLMQLAGVGPKVADCVLLFAAGKFEAFPVDVWIERVMEKLYFGGKKTTDEKIREFAGGYFGEYAGYAQQYLYYYAREKNI